MYINFEKLSDILGFGKTFWNRMKVFQNCEYIKSNFKKGKTGTAKLFQAIENFECGMMNEEADYSLEKWKADLD